METTPLSRFLHSICRNSPWNYAVFWKLQYQNQMILTFEDYCHTPKQRNSMESILHNICFKGSDEILSSSIYDGSMGTNPVELAVANMSSIQHTLGDGVVGEVACSGNYRWVFSDDISAGEYSSKLVPEWPDDWIVQFASGFKTLLLVPVVPHGVLQLGSLETVAEDLALVANLKSKFLAYQEFVECSVPFSANMHFNAHSASSLMSTLVENELSGLSMNGIKSEDSTLVSSSVLQRCHMLSTTNQITPPNKGENLQKIVGEDILKIPNTSTENDVSVRLMGLREEPEDAETLGQSFDCNALEMIENNLFRFSCIEEEFQSFSHPNDDNMGTFRGEYAVGTMKSYSDMGMSAQSLVDNGAGNFYTFFSFPRDCELHKALGSTIMGQKNRYLWETPVLGEDEYYNSSLTCNGEFSYVTGTGPTVWETGGPFIKGHDGKHLLGSVVTDVNCSLDKNLSDIKSSSTSLEQFSAFPEEQLESERRTLVVEDAASRSCGASVFADKGRNANNSTSPSASSFESVMSAMIGEEQQKKGHRSTHPRKGSKLSSDSKRRARTGDNQKPRPRDRQLIQDCLKELRDLVPNGVKCSIDGLLDRTIQHMLFLRSVTDQADRLSQLVHKEVAGGKNLKSAERDGGQQNGTSWAFELGSEQQICPIIVEDLEYPGHMLIEMLCNEHGRFLEISETICRLKLSVLKGVMENRLGSTWAQFVVEVPRGFHRLDIFWPLMQLLQ